MRWLPSFLVVLAFCDLLREAEAWSTTTTTKTTTAMSGTTRIKTLWTISETTFRKSIDTKRHGACSIRRLSRSSLRQYQGHDDDDDDDDSVRLSTWGGKRWIPKQSPKARSPARGGVVLATFAWLFLSSFWVPCHPAHAACTVPVPRIEETQQGQGVVTSTATATAPKSFLVINQSPQQLLLAVSFQQQQQQQQGSVLDEVWTLIDKYYMDRTFNKQDWKKVKQIYEAKLRSNNGRDEMKVVKEMVSTLGDKYSRLLDVEQYTAIQKFDLIGVGVTLMSASPPSPPVIVVGAPPIAGSAADLAGIQVGDKVLAINGVSTEKRTAFDIIDQIAETPNAKTITMTIQPAAVSNENDDNKNNNNNNGPEKKSLTREVTMERQFTEVKNPIRYKIAEKRKDGMKVGYIRISEFNSLIKGNLEKALRDLKAQGANAYVLDLRMNGGGAFQSAVEVSSYFFANRVATYVADGSTQLLPFKTAKNQVLVDDSVPIVLWVDGGSASASEVLAASLHDNCRAVIMGYKSFGKGLIQAVYGLKNGAGLVLTVAKTVRPNQSEIQGAGIQPDIPGKNIIPNVFVPSLLGGTDTSKIDFDDISNRLSAKLCTVPQPQ